MKKVKSAVDKPLNTEEQCMKKVKITVVKTLNTREIHRNSDLGCSQDLQPTCPVFAEGEEFIVTHDIPRRFCQGAWADIFRYIDVVRFGGNFPWINEEGKYLACCTDGFRPVIFRIERLEEETEGGFVD
jgi:uncharacterized repeat protein (TIGR04076 family)